MSLFPNLVCIVLLVFVGLIHEYDAAAAREVELYMEQVVAKADFAQNTIFRCPGNATLIESNYFARCNGREGFKQFHGTSLAKALHGQSCDPEEEDSCDYAHGLKCSNSSNTCYCQYGDSSDVGKCRIGAWRRCGYWSVNSQCTKNSNCESHNGFKTCICDSSFTEINRMCFAKHGTACSESEDCLSGLACIDFVCRCENPLQYSFENDACKGLVDAACSSNDSCTENSHCRSGKCGCASGYQENKNGRCVTTLKGAGESCVDGDKCDFNRGLACINRNCTCLDASLRLTQDGYCVASVGRICGMTKTSNKCEDDPKYRARYSSEEDCDYFTIGCEDSALCRAVGKELGRCELVYKSGQSDGVAQTL